MKPGIDMAFGVVASATMSFNRKKDMVAEATTPSVS